MKTSKVFLMALMMTSWLVVGDASANLILRLTQGANTVTVTDANDDGRVDFVGSVGIFFVNTSTGLSDPITGTKASPWLSLNSVNVSTGAGTLVIELTDTDFIGGNAFNFSSSIGGTTFSSVEWATYLDPTNTEFGTSVSLFSGGPFGPISYSASGSSSYSVPVGLYSLTQIVTITHTVSTQTSTIDANLRGTVPEPATIALLGLGLAGLGVIRGKRS